MKHPTRALLLLFALCGAARAQNTASSPAGLPTRLLQRTDLVYKCAFRLPLVQSATDDKGFAFALHGFAFNPARNSLFLNGHTYIQRTAEVSIPPCGPEGGPLPRGGLLQPLADATAGQLANYGAGGGAVNPASVQGTQIGGLFVYGNQLIGDVYGYYDFGSPTFGQLSHFKSGLNLSAQGDFQGMYKLGTLNQGYAAGYMAAVAPEWVSAIGAPLLTGQCCLSNINRTSRGPAAIAFDPADLKGPPATVVPATPLVYYPPEHQTLGSWDNKTVANPVYNMTTEVAGMAMPVGTRTLLFFGKTEVGIPCYGVPTSDPALHKKPVPNAAPQVYCYTTVGGGGTGMHCSECSLYVWAYDVADLVEVKKGTKRPWDVKPYASWPFTLPFGGFDLQGVAYDPAKGLIYMSLSMADMSLPDGSRYNPAPVVFVWQVSR